MTGFSYAVPIARNERGPRVAHAQHLLQGANRFARNFHPGPVDGIWGGRAQAAADEARYELGYPRSQCVLGTYGEKLHGFLTDTRLPATYLARRLRRRGTTLTFDPLTHGARECAQQLLRYHSQGKYRADNPGDLRDVERTAAGLAVWSQGGYWVHIDPRVMRVLCHLIGKGHSIGTYAICSDHHNDGPHGHAGGFAVDVHSIDGVQVAENSGRSRGKTLAVDRLLHAAGSLRPRQLITGGYGNHRDWSISALSLPAADSYYGSGTMSQHTNHIHVGY